MITCQVDGCNGSPIWQTLRYNQPIRLECEHHGAPNILKELAKWHKPKCPMELALYPTDYRFGYMETPYGFQPCEQVGMIFVEGEQ